MSRILRALFRRPLIVAPAVKYMRNLLALAFALSVPLAAQSLTAVMTRIDKTAPQFKSMTADIKRTVHTAIVNDETVENGTIKFKREKAGDTRALIAFTGPDAKSVAFDGASVSLYYPKIKTVQIYNVGDKRGLIDQFLLLGFGATSAELQTAYEITWVGMEKIAAKPANHLQLIPRSKEALQRLKKAELWIDADTGTPVQQRFVTSASGDFMLVTYTSMKANAPLSDGSLKLIYPKVVQIERPQL